MKLWIEEEIKLKKATNSGVWGGTAQFTYHAWQGRHLIFHCHRQTKLFLYPTTSLRAQALPQRWRVPFLREFPVIKDETFVNFLWFSQRPLQDRQKCLQIGEDVITDVTEPSSDACLMSRRFSWSCLWRTQERDCDVLSKMSKMQLVFLRSASR